MNAVAVEPEGADARSEPDVSQALAQLKEALKIIDALELSPDIGALLQEVINRLADTEKASR